MNLNNNELKIKRYLYYLIIRGGIEFSLFFRIIRNNLFFQLSKNRRI